MVTLRLLVLSFVFLLTIVVASGQETLTNEGIINLVKSGMSEDLIMNVIAKQPASFALGASDLVALKNAGVSERILTAMVNKTTGAAPTEANRTAPAAAPSAPVLGGRQTVTEPGVYYKKSGEFLEMLAEDVEWKTVGALKAVASAGIIKKDLKGNITGPSSRNFLQTPIEIIISPPSGMTINDYILLPMRPTEGVREFEVGPVNKKSGVAKGAIAFGVEKVGSNQFRMVFPTALGPGEYGIISSKSIAGPAEATTRMFTFRLLI